MKYIVKVIPEAQDDINKLERTQQNKLKTDYKTIQEVDIDAVHINSLGNKLFEIKTSELRSIYEYRKGQVVVIAVVFIKKSQKTDEKYIKRAKKLLEKYKEI